MAKAKKSLGPTYVYTITHNATGNSYVGITSRPIRARWADHMRRAYKADTNMHIHNAIRFYGPEAFDWQVVSLCETREDAILAEMTWIAAGWSYYNKTKGGEGVLGVPKTKKQLEAARNNRRGKPAWNRGLSATNEARAAISAAMKGKPHCAENAKIARQKKAEKGNPQSEYQRQRTRETWLGRRHTDEAKAKIAASSKGRRRTPESIDKANATRKERGVKSCGSPENTKKGWITRKYNIEKRQLIESMGTSSEIFLDG